ncbi:HlyD family type I secretion periplasmic adaptor subunit [Photobacterium carnosum]|uniref:HlyD family type I secretion periplasmic adaptor subunit n=1 Tax=Photobacterium carnosum TaxID=2023717 RepID=UPI001E30C1BA|nr:HlyD family type I secretion periplasmic adaptor subunit [Photobacterium carnosum]MCD9531955.1 HlyD family type I secretion periplasmic adaptor subunit [Photobacterium carnosum]MCF2155818.1 HlyD family type I secretion periplasmic adaptor subunit [Photobacterium carnosum]MCF2217672.1 HlyD family type I secretion periplasmic adaptor subunit [Photobacterium carnosum]
MSKKNISISTNDLDFIDDKSSALLLNTPKSARIILWVIVLFFFIAFTWAYFAKLDKVTTGSGKVIPSSQLQVVQNLEGGIVKQVFVKEGQQVKKGQTLLLIDDTQFKSDFEEKTQSLAAMQADSLRLNALLVSVTVNKNTKNTEWRKSVNITSIPPVFTPNFKNKHAQLVRRQLNQFTGKLNNLENQLSVASQQASQKERELTETRSRVSNLRDSYNIAMKEYNITKPLADEGVVPRIELLKLQRSLNDTKRDLNSAKLQVPVTQAAIQEAKFKYIDIALQFRSEIQAKLNEISDKLSSMKETQIGLKDRVKRTTVISPVTGTIQKIYVNTVGGVIQPGMPLVEIVPTEDTLLIEAKIAPQDIGFLRPGLPTIIKFSAYDFTNYGGLKGTVETISADTIQDKKGNSFYQVKIRTNASSLKGPNGEALPIIPGMTASADIITGKRSVLDYLLKPILRARQTALRE